MKVLRLAFASVVAYISMGSVESNFKQRIFCKDLDMQNGQCNVKDLRPVCGWLPDTKCIVKPCTVDGENVCDLCDIKGVDYITDGECPKMKEIATDVKFPYFCKTVDRLIKHCPEVNMPSCGVTRKFCDSNDCVFDVDNPCDGCTHEIAKMVYKGKCPKFPDVPKGWFDY